MYSTNDELFDMYGMNADDLSNCFTCINHFETTNTWPSNYQHQKHKHQQYAVSSFHKSVTMAYLDSRSTYKDSTTTAPLLPHIVFEPSSSCPELESKCILEQRWQHDTCIICGRIANENDSSTIVLKCLKCLHVFHESCISFNILQQMKHLSAIIHNNNNNEENDDDSNTKTYCMLCIASTLKYSFNTLALAQEWYKKQLYNKRLTHPPFNAEQYTSNKRFGELVVLIKNDSSKSLCRIYYTGTTLATSDISFCLKDCTANEQLLWSRRICRCNFFILVPARVELSEIQKTHSYYFTNMNWFYAVEPAHSLTIKEDEKKSRRATTHSSNQLRTLYELPNAMVDFWKSLFLKTAAIQEHNSFVYDLAENQLRFPVNPIYRDDFQTFALPMTRLGDIPRKTTVSEQDKFAAQVISKKAKHLMSLQSDIPKFLKLTDGHIHSTNSRPLLLPTNQDTTNIKNNHLMSTPSSSTVSAPAKKTISFAPINEDEEEEIIQEVEEGVVSSEGQETSDAQNDEEFLEEVLEESQPADVVVPIKPVVAPQPSSSSSTQNKKPAAVTPSAPAKQTDAKKATPAVVAPAAKKATPSPAPATKPVSEPAPAKKSVNVPTPAPKTTTKTPAVPSATVTVSAPATKNTAQKRAAALKFMDLDIPVATKEELEEDEDDEDFGEDITESQDDDEDEGGESQDEDDPQLVSDVIEYMTDDEEEIPAAKTKKTTKNGKGKASTSVAAPKKAVSEKPKRKPAATKKTTATKASLESIKKKKTTKQEQEQEEDLVEEGEEHAAEEEQIDEEKLIEEAEGHGQQIKQQTEEGEQEDQNMEVIDEDTHVSSTKPNGRKTAASGKRKRGGEASTETAQPKSKRGKSSTAGAAADTSSTEEVKELVGKKSRMTDTEKRRRFMTYLAAQFSVRADIIRKDPKKDTVDVFARGNMTQEEYARAQYEGLAVFVMLLSDDIKKQIKEDKTLLINNVKATCTDKEWNEMCNSPQFRHAKSILYNHFYKYSGLDHHSKPKASSQVSGDF